MDIAYPTLHGDLQSFMFSVYRNEITEIVEKYPHSQYEPEQQVFTYTGSDQQELKSLVGEVLAMPDLKKVLDFCVKQENYQDKYYLCRQSDIVVNNPNKIELQLKDGRTINSNRINILTFYKDL